MQEISTAPKDGTLVTLLNKETGQKYGPLHYDMAHKNWVGLKFTPMGAVNVEWDNAKGLPTHWENFQ